MLAFLKSLLLAISEYFRYSNNEQLLEAGGTKKELEIKNEAEKDIAIAEAVRNDSNVDYSFLLPPDQRGKPKK